MTSPSQPSDSPPGSRSAQSRNEPSTGPAEHPPSATAPAPITDLISPKVRNGIAIVITAMWGAGIMADALSRDFELSPFVYVTMLGLASAIYGANFIKGVKP